MAIRGHSFQAQFGHIFPGRGSSLAGMATSAVSARGLHVADHLRPLHPSEMTPAERAAAVAALLAAGLLRHLHPALFPSPTGTTNSQEKTGEST